jgi:MFS family permease
MVIRSAFWIAVIPAALCVALIVFGVREPDGVAARDGGPRPTLSLRDVRRLDRRFVFVTIVAAVLTLARFSEAFLVLRATDVGMPLAQAPWVMVAMTVVYAAVAFPAGVLADRGHSPRLIGAGFVALIASDLVLAHANGAAAVLAGAALWGLHMALTQGLLSALVAAVAPADLRGTAFGVFNLASGVAVLAASALAGWLWDAAGPRYTFYAGAAFTLVAWLALRARRQGLPAIAG